jgi:hypothetical protein
MTRWCVLSHQHAAASAAQPQGAAAAANGLSAAGVPAVGFAALATAGGTDQPSGSITAAAAGVVTKWQHNRC